MTHVVERVASGIPGLDDLIDGGIPRHSSLLVSGGTGSGKTTFCIQFLKEGLQNGERCLYITTEQSPDQIKEDAMVYGKDLEEHGDAFNIMYIDPATKTEHVGEAIRKAAKQVDPDRLVVDSLSVIGAYWGDQADVRSNIHHLVTSFRDMESTVVFTGEAPHDTALTRHGVAEYVVDAVISLGGLSLGRSTFRSMQIIKMRKTDIPSDVFGLNMSDSGITVSADERF